MVASGVEEPRLDMDSVTLDQQGFQRFVEKELEPSLTRFRINTRHTVSLHLLFLGLLVSELFLFTLFFTLLARSHLISMSFALFFLTLFSYFILRLYWNAHRMDRILEQRASFLDRCRDWIGFQEGIPEHHLALAQAASRFSGRLQDEEYSLYPLPSWLEPLNSAAEKFSCFWHWEDVHLLREALLKSSIDQHLKLVKCEPTNLEVHASLANAYVLLSSLYAQPQLSDDEERWVPPERYSDEMAERFRETASHAIEEFQILSDYAPNDPWIHMQLAYSYHDLNMPEEEIREYETILELRPDDKETLFKLGVLYFKQGRNSQGLRIYEELRHTHYKRAEALITFYGASSL